MRRDEDLLAAYVDGVAELAPDERRRVAAVLEAPGARADEAELRRVIDQLRALPPEGQEPDWMAMERSIRDAVGAELPRPWWRRWTWMAPVTTFATAALVLLIVWGRPRPALEPAPTRSPVRAVPAPAPSAPASDEPVALWLDGTEVDAGPGAAEALEALAPAEPDDAAELGLLPPTGLAWVDGLDDEAIDRAERWLDGKKKG